MAKNYSVVGQAAPAAATSTSIFTVPTGKYCVLSTISIANRDPELHLAYRIAVVPSGQTLAAKHYLAYDTILSGRSTDKLTWGITIGAGDQVYVQSSTANASFSLFGVQNDVTGG